MSSTFALPSGFAYVGASLVSTVFLLLGQSTVVGKYRKRAGIAYPQVYAEKAEAASSIDAMKFNCAQRAHQNTLENIPIIYVVTIVTGLKFPVFAAASCALWTISRISYTSGYVTGDPKKRVTPLYLVGLLATIGQLLTATYTVGSWIYADLKV